MKIDFRHLVIFIIGAPVAVLQFGYPFLPQAIRPYANSVEGTGIFGIIAVVLVYNKLKYGTFFPGPPRPDGL
jgi:hypothetical protein